jgi:ATP-dependent helicase/nuclease subunit A
VAWRARAADRDLSNGVPNDLPELGMSQMSFDADPAPRQLSLGELAVTPMSPDDADLGGRGLTDEQELAVERRSEPLLLAAGAGSGKTSVLVERFVRAVREDGVAPGRILAITFTERAAGELRKRVRARFVELGERGAARDTEAAFVSTFHGFCARLLRAHSLAAGLDPEFTILDEGLAARLRARAWAAALRGFLEGERDEAVDLVAAWGADRVRAIVVGTYAELRSKGERLPSLPAPVFQQTLPAPVLQAMRLESASSEVLVGEQSHEQTPTDQAPSDGVPEGASSEEASSNEMLAKESLAGEIPSEEPGEADAQGTRACALLRELLEGFGREYAALKSARCAVDFDDLELDACTLLEEHETVRRSWAERFELLMVDEFQDTNPRQLAILRALERGNLFTVGDALQSIYGFRHADVSLFRARRKELAEHGGSLSLTRNFRSRKPLLDVVNEVFADRFGDGFTSLRAGRVEETALAEPLVELLLTDKGGWSDDGLGERIAGELPPAPRWRQAEARLLAQRVAELVQSGAAKAGDVAVLLRAVGDLEVYELALQECGLNTLATVGGFWRSQQVGDLLAYLRTLANPLDELALYGTLASPLVGLSSDGLALLGRAAKAGRRSVWETIALGEGEGEVEGVGSKPVGEEPVGNERRGHGLQDADSRGELESRLAESRVAEPRSEMRLSALDRGRLVRFRARLQAERAAAPRHTLSQLIERALDQSGYAAHVLTLSWPERRLANVHKLLRLARRYEAGEGRDLRGFLDHVAHQREGLGGAEPDAPVADGETEAVRLMSIHAAKGLEFGVVCVADLGRTQNLGVPDLLVDGDRVGLRVARLDGSAATPSLAWPELAEERRAAQAEEEDRILYVAMTRARERLLLSGSVDFERWPEQRLGAPPISWLGPALSAELPTSVQTLDPPVRELAVGASDAEQVRVALCLNAPETLGAVLRLDGLPSASDGPTSAPPSSRVDATAIGGQAERSSRPSVLVAEEEAPTGATARPGDGGRPGERHRERPDTLSYTSLTELDRCSYRFYLERVLNLPERRSPTLAEGRPREDGLDARVRGTIVHRLLESLDFLRSAAPTADDVARAARELGVRVAPHEREELAALLGAALDTPLAARLRAVTQGAHREHPFALSLGPAEPLLTGVLDILAREPSGGMLVVDYKSDRVDPDEDLAAVVEREYSIQRRLYALAVLADGAPRVEVVHWFLQRPDEPIAAVFTADDRRPLEDTIAQLVKDARARPFIVSENPHRGLCATCPGRSGLCSWSDSFTLRERA